MMWPRQSMTTSFSNISTANVRQRLHSARYQADDSSESCLSQQTNSYKYSHTTLEFGDTRWSRKNLLPSQLDKEEITARGCWFSYHCSSFCLLLVERSLVCVTRMYRSATRFMPLIRNDVMLLGKEAWHSSAVSCGQQRLNRFVRNYYPRQRYYSEPQGNGFQKFGKPTLFMVGSIGCTDPFYRGNE